MTILEFQKRIANKYEVSSIKMLTTYVIKLKGAGSVILQYNDNQFKTFMVAGKEKENIEKLLLN